MSGNTSIMTIHPSTMSANRELQIWRPAGGALGGLEDGVLVARLVNPVFSTEATASLLDCSDKAIATVRWLRPSDNMAVIQSFFHSCFGNPYLRKAEVFNHDGVHVANMGGTRVADWFALTDPKDGKILIEFRMEELPTLEKMFLVFGKYSRIEIKFMPGFMPPPYILVDPRFLGLVAAAHLAPGSLYVPLMVVLACLLLCCCTCFCCIKCRRRSPFKDYSEVRTNEGFGPAVLSTVGSRDVRLNDSEAKTSWLPVPSFGRSAACCNRVAPTPSNPTPSRAVSKRF